MQLPAVPRLVHKCQKQASGHLIISGLRKIHNSSPARHRPVPAPAGDSLVVSRLWRILPGRLCYDGALPPGVTACPDMSGVFANAKIK